LLSSTLEKATVLGQAAADHIDARRDRTVLTQTAASEEQQLSTHNGDDEWRRGHWASQNDSHVLTVLFTYYTSHFSEK
jgi:hypothetical protein